MSPTSGSDDRTRANRRVVIACVAVLALMTGAAFAAVPLYRAFCQATGFGGYVPRASRAPSQVLDQQVVVSFDTNVRGLPWTFEPLQRSQTVRVGATGLAFFTVTNASNDPLTGRAAYNVAPAVAGAYVRKLQCFCFTDQTIPPHTTVKFPVLYFIDPQFASDPDTKGYSNLVLAYTFFPAPKPVPKAAGALGG